MTDAGGADNGLVMFSPMPPRANGIGDYCFELLGHLSRTMSCTVVVEDGTDTALAPAGVPIITESEYMSRDLWRLLHVYQVGNNPDHIYMLPHLSRVPGLLVLHDASLHYLLDRTTLGRGDKVGYESALAAEYGAAGEILGAQFSEFGLRDEAMFQIMPMTGGMLGAARGVIVHSMFAASKVLARAPAANVSIVPHHFCAPVSDSGPGPAEQRLLLGIEARELMFLSLGFVTCAKQVDTALRALAARRKDLPPFRYVIAGELRPDELDIEALVDELGLRAHVLLLGYVPEAAFFALARAADVVINLRHPIGGETSGTMIRALGCGACVVVVDRGPFAEIPDGAAVKLAWDNAFQARLADTLVQLSADKPARKRIGQAAAAYIAAVHSLDKSAAAYGHAIDAARRTPPPRWASMVDWQTAAPSAVHLERAAGRNSLGSDGALPRWFLAGIVPRAVGECRVAAVGGEPRDKTLLQLLGHADIAFVNAGSVASIPARSIDLFILFSQCSSAVLRNVNAALAFGGRLVLIGFDLECSAQAKDAEMVQRVGVDLVSHGFQLATSCCDTVPSLNPQDEDDGDLDNSACWSAMKSTEFDLPRDADLRLPVAA
jgi:glycosyltransferase involved in cell wall biosynthesis